MCMGRGGGKAISCFWVLGEGSAWPRDWSGILGSLGGFPPRSVPTALGLPGPLSCRWGPLFFFFLKNEVWLVKI
jgi:hypothetical protein